ncbi:hypothetical protein F511_03883 [Dorcoceras hygrometricum]|uniref:Uncharacterized protein n=1 Tax=Dorcoceras hygrometricum TaxID=472368 RepID=A0A2Z7AYI2_9LAMI|nr:hypothetical protein F511_03883 [Dorcoceras hygrometricum]
MTEQSAQELIAVEELPPIVQYFFVEATDSIEQPAPVGDQPTPVARQPDTGDEHQAQAYLSRLVQLILLSGHKRSGRKLFQVASCFRSYVVSRPQDELTATS